jgi:hypothetical protein
MNSLIQKNRLYFNNKVFTSLISEENYQDNLLNRFNYTKPVSCSELNVINFFNETVFEK